MENGESGADDAADAAELAARRAIETDAYDWRGHAALADALVARKQVQEAILAARRAVALAPDEPAARLALTDALLAVAPRRMRIRAEAFAEIDQAELLGTDFQDLADRRARAQPMTAVANVVIWGSLWLLMFVQTPPCFSRPANWAGLVLLLAATAVVRVRHDGRTLREVIGTKRELARRRMTTTEQVMARAPAAAMVLGFLVLPAASLSIPAVDGNAQSLPATWLLLGCIPLIGMAAWIGVDRWLRPGTAIRVLRHDAFTAVSIPITFVLATASPVMVLDHVHRPGLWFTLLMAQFGWIAANGIAGMTLTTRRKRAAYGLVTVGQVDATGGPPP